jgi:hypothetical protein
MRRQLIFALLVVAGCAGSGSVSYQGSANVYATTPDLVYVSPGVQVIADYDEPVFYTDGFYWRHYGGTWYRSRVHTGGWVYASAPRALLTIERPHAYVRYRPRGYVSRRQTQPSRPVYRDERPVIRDRRTAPAPAPVTRDHRTPPGHDRREERQERREERVEDNQERRDERQDRREDRREDREDRREDRDERRDDRRDRRDDRR